LRFLSANEVKEIFTISDALKAVEEVCAENAKGNTEIPNRIRIENTENSSDTLFMPCRLSQMEVMGLKIVSGMPNNIDKGLPISVGIVIIFDDKTGMPLLIMEAGYLTNMRTGAFTGVACKYLARPESEKIAIIGTGMQAQTQLLAVVEVLKLSEVRVYSRKPKRVHNFIETMEKILPDDITFIPAKSGEAACLNADVIVCATSATSPVLLRKWISCGAFISAIGAHTPWDREVDSNIIRDASLVVADYRKAVLNTGGDIVIPIKEGLIEEEEVVDLGELILGTKKGRQSADEITFFKSVGFASIDIYIGAKLLEKAKVQGLGIEVPLFISS